MKKVFITGCAKTGTTLLLRMCLAFENAFIDYREGFNGHEISIEDFVKQENSEKEIMISKRLHPCLLSSVNNKELFDHQRDLIKENNVGIINVIRDGRDTIVSDGNYVKPRRWIDSMKQREMYSDVINYEVRYEDLVDIEKTNLIQEGLMAEFGLKKSFNFSDYPNYVPDWIYDWNVSVTGRAGNQLSDYSKRPLSNASVGKGLKTYKELCDPEIIDEFHEQLKTLKYT